MRQVRVSGTLPASIAEDSGPGDWTGSLALAGDVAWLTGIEVLGPGGLFFTARLDATRTLAVLQPAARLDYEALGAGASIAFTLRFSFADGTRQDAAARYGITVLDRDDTPPASLGFLVGGSVVAGAIGANIGLLSIADPDSAGPFLFTFSEEDAWRFEVVGTTLKLREGISLGLDDVGTRPLVIEVSDGRQGAAFTLDLMVRNPDDGGLVVQLLEPGMVQQGFAQTGATVPGAGLDGVGEVLAVRSTQEVAAINLYGGELREVLLRDGAVVWLPPTGVLRFTDGWVDFATDGLAAQAAALHRAATGGMASSGELATLTGALQAGTGWAELAASLLASGPAMPDDAAFLAALHRSALGREATATELDAAADRLGAGLSRAQLVADLALGTEGLQRQAASSPEGIWVSEALGQPGIPTGRDVDAPFAPPAAVVDAAPMDLAWFL